MGSRHQNVCFVKQGKVFDLRTDAFVKLRGNGDQVELNQQECFFPVPEDERPDLQIIQHFREHAEIEIAGE